MAGQSGARDATIDIVTEIVRLEHVMRAGGWAEHTSLECELRSWDRLSDEVNSYRLTVDDYTNDVSSRDYLAQFAVQASAELRADLEPRLRTADARFRAATVPDDDGRLGRRYCIGPQDAWWWHRRPSHGPLATWLAEYGRGEC